MRYFYLVLICLFAKNIFGQIEVKDVATPPYNPQNLIYNELLGEGVQIVDVVYEGTNNSVGFFNNAEQSVGINSGILLTTGVVSTFGANTGIDQVGSVEASVDNGSTVQDADVATLADFSLFNISKYTITFIPSSDSISFRYVFASEEYPEFVCSDYNDIFGFFISGPGINGPYENNAENIALIPGTNLPVKINNVNGGVVGSNGLLSNCENGNGFLSFSEFYNDNNGSDNQPVFDGFLKVFTASAKVTPCQTYTIKIVVADQGDPQRDSGVFLEAKSFSSDVLSANVVTKSIDGTIIEGCTDATLEITIPNPESNDLNLDFSVFGSATEGTDFPNIPPIIIPAGETAATIHLEALEDNTTEGLESLFFDIQLNQCFRDTFSLLISDSQIPTVDLGNDTMVCPGTTLSFNIEDLNSSLPTPATFTATNTNVPITSPPPGVLPMEVNVPLEVVGVSPLTLGPGLIQSVCIDIDHNRLEDLEMYLVAPDGQLMALSTGNGGTEANYNNTCFTVDATTSIRDGIAPFMGDFLPEEDWSKLWANDSPLNGTWNLVVIDGQFGFNGIINDWSITFNPVVSYTYTWENTDGLSCTDCLNPTIIANASNDYILKLEDNYGCISTDTFSVTVFENIDELPLLTCTDQTFDALTFAWNTVSGAVSYEININGTGWTTISNPDTTYTVENLALGEMVDFAVRANGGCNSMESSTNCTTLDCTPITLANQTIDEVSCNGFMDGVIRVEASGDNPPFSYDLNGTINNNGVFENLAVGNYTLIITDMNNCNNSFDLEVTAPTALLANPTTISNIGCNGEDGRATVQVSGGTAPYSFEWSTNATDSIISSAMGGNFQVTIQDANNCELTETVSIADYTPMALTFDSTATCMNDNSGVVEVNVTGGQAPYTFEWDSNAGGATTNRVDNLAPDTYSVTVQDANNCEVVGTVTVEAIPTLNAPQISCGTVTSDAITFIWSDQMDANGFEVNVENNGWAPASDSLSHTVAGLSLGQTINIEVRAIGECSPPIGTGTCTTVDCSLIDVDNNINHVSCNGLSDGVITVTATGDQPPFQYEMNGDSNTTGIFNNLSAGDYTILITDNIGCTATTQVTVTAPTALQAIVTVSQEETCDQSGQATLVIEGGNTPYNIAWSNGIIDETSVNLASGDHTVSIVDVTGCFTEAMVTITPYIPMAATVSTVDNTCETPPVGSASVTVTGGNGTYNYLWNDAQAQTTATANQLIAGTYTVVITDESNCSITQTAIVNSPSGILIDSIVGTSVSCAGGTDGQATAFITGGNMPLDYLWENSQTTATATNLSTGSYALVVRDADGCEAMSSVTITEPTPVSLVAPPVSILCPEDSANLVLTVMGGTPDYSYRWSTGATSKDLNNLNAGQYEVTVTDGNNCVATLISDVLAATDFSLSLNKTNIQCENTADGQILAMVEGGVSPYVYEWSTGATTTSIDGLSAGTYRLSVTDANGCIISAIDSLNSPNNIEITTELIQPICPGDNGSMMVTANGGTGALTIILDGINYGSDNQINNLSPATYNLVVRDANNCEQSVSDLVITAPTAIGIDLQAMISVDLGDSLLLQPEITGGTMPYDYFWEAEQSEAITCLDCPNPTIYPLNTGSFNLDIMDANGCPANANILVQVNKERKIYAPNAFSPNFDGINDQFMIFGKNIRSIKQLNIFDRWGNRIYNQQNISANDEFNGWDGTFQSIDMAPATFVWFAQIEFLDGVIELYQGEVNLIR